MKRKTKKRAKKVRGRKLSRSELHMFGLAAAAKQKVDDMEARLVKIETSLRNLESTAHGIYHALNAVGAFVDGAFLVKAHPVQVRKEIPA